MKKAAIMTFQSANNYGAFLQAYALSSALNSMEDVSAEIVDYVCPDIEKNYNPKSILKRNENPLKKRIKYLMRKSGMQQCAKQFQAARDKHFPMKSTRTTSSALSELEQQYDVFIAGSDQVWNKTLTGNDRAYFLNFVKDSSKKVSYAASMGECDWSEQEKAEIKEDLQSFSHISIREADAAQKASQLIDRNDIEICADPVFLRTAEQWRNFARKPQKSGYILFFMMGMSPDAEAALKFAKDKAKRENKTLLLLSDQDRPYKYIDIKHLHNVDPMGFVGYIDNADCVVTNSFHATAFSIILQKDFYVETNIKRSQRVLNLLEMADLSERALKKGVPCSDKNSEINWDNTVNRMSHYIESSVEYLTKAVKGTA